MPHLTIRTKLALAFVGVALTIIALTFFAMLLSFRAGFLQYINDTRLDVLNSFSEIIKEEIISLEDWQQLSDQRFYWDNLLQRLRYSSDNPLVNMPPRRKPKRERDDDSPKRPPPKDLALYLLDSEHNIIYGAPRKIIKLSLRPITIDGRIVGYVGIRKFKTFSFHADKLFVSKQTKYFFFIVILAGIISVISAFFLSRWMTGPIQRLHKGMQQLMERDYSGHIDYFSKDEIGNLVHAYNRLNKTLQEHEKSQQQWIADISHELRTPLATLRGEIEALQDGVRELTIKRVNSLHEEVLHLQRMVDDLHQLALSDLGAMRYQFNNTYLSELLEKLSDSYQDRLQEQELKLSWAIKGKEQSIDGDSDRLYQLFSNLLQNSLRYTDAPGEITITLDYQPDNTLQLTWEDTAPGVSSEHLPKLFDRLYREEKSRNRAQGGSGLGLSICKAIIEAHQGTITAQASTFGGLAIIITLPKL